MANDQHTSMSLEDLVSLFRVRMDVRYEIRRTDTENKIWGEKRALQDELRDRYAPATRAVNETSERVRLFFESDVPEVQTRVMPEFLPGLEERLADCSMARDRLTPYETQLRQAQLLSRAEYDTTDNKIATLTAESLQLHARCDSLTEKSEHARAELDQHATPAEQQKTEAAFAAVEQEYKDRLDKIEQDEEDWELEREDMIEPNESRDKLYAEGYLAAAKLGVAIAAFMLVASEANGPHGPWFINKS